MIQNIQKSPEMFEGLQVSEIIFENELIFSSKEYFYTASPIFAKYLNESKTYTHLTFKDDKTGKHLEKVLKMKMEKAGMQDDSLKIYFDKEYKNPKVKLVEYKGIKNKVNVCPVIIEGKPETIAFAYAVGLGNSTGIGFGAIKK